MTRCGSIAIVGRPNVGKSTLLNRLIGQKLSITAHKPQTTRHNILGVKTVGDTQAIYIDTPGIHLHGKRALNQILNKSAASSLHDADVIILVVQSLVWNEHDQRAFDLVISAASSEPDSPIPVYLFVNKTDLVENKNQLLPYLSSLPESEHCTAVIPGSAKDSTALDTLEKAVFTHLPEGPFQFHEDDLTDRSSRFLAAEHVREQLTRLLSEELPYALTVEIEQFEESPKMMKIGAVIWVEKSSQKGIVIGKNGEKLKDVGTRARKSMEKLFGQKIFLQLWVRVKEGWADDERALRSLGYEE